MELNAQRDGDIVSVAVEGRLDSTNASQFEEAVNAEVGGSNCSLILDLENLAYISSAGLRAILLITKAIKVKGANIALCALPNQIEEVFSISGFDKIIPIHPTRQAAVDSLS